MSVFAPEIPPLPSPPPAELLGRFVPAALRRTPPDARFWGLPRLLASGLLTAGYLPCFALQTRVYRVSMLQAQQCERAADLLALHVPPDEAAELRAAAGRVRVSVGWTWLARALAALALGFAVAWLGTTFDSNALSRFWLYPTSGPDPLLITSALLQVVAYLLVFVPLNRQATAMQQFALAFNATAGEHVGPIDPPPLVWGLNWAWTSVGILVAVCGPVWVLPMLVAWAGFGQFVHRSAMRFRVQLAERLQDIGGVETVVPRADLCQNPDCRCSLPVQAQFCPRCGRGVPA